jgi:hypothetical protein
LGCWMRMMGRLVPEGRDSRPEMDERPVGVSWMGMRWMLCAVRVERDIFLMRRK